MEQWLKTGSLTSKRRKLNETPVTEELPSTSESSSTSNEHKETEVLHETPVTDELPSTSENPSTSNEREETEVLEVGKDVTSKEKRSSLETKTKKRKYMDIYMNYGFSYEGDEDSPKPRCVVCGDILSNSSMKPSPLRRHLQTRHPEYKDKNAYFFTRLSSTNMKTYLKSAASISDNATEASFHISYHIAKAGKNHTIGENLIKPCIIGAVKCMLGEKSAKIMNDIPISDSTVSRRIQIISDQIEETTLKNMKDANFFSIQVDESTDVAHFSVLLVIARYVNY
uniref:Zinc finger BED domain-containing protein 5 n=1 Tax=Cacopsylla melanoneura TaxID=428564 RepID=A0A8D9A690_9HEMI